MFILLTYKWMWMFQWMYVCMSVCLMSCMWVHFICKFVVAVWVVFGVDEVKKLLVVEHHVGNNVKWFLCKIAWLTVCLLVFLFFSFSFLLPVALKHFISPGRIELKWCDGCGWVSCWCFNEVMLCWCRRWLFLTTTTKNWWRWFLTLNCCLCI